MKAALVKQTAILPAVAALLPGLMAGMLRHHSAGKKAHFLQI